MKQTIKDVQRLSKSSVKLIKMGIYYLAIPLFVAVGLQTVSKPALNL